MKHLLLLSAITIIIITGCKKEEEVDPRDQFTGNYSGTTTISIPSLDVVETSEYTCVISKLSESSKIQFTNDDGSILYAKVSGNSYVYDKYTEIENYNGETYTIEMTGNGSINGTIVTESGSYKIHAYGETFSGTWQGTLMKQ